MHPCGAPIHLKFLDRHAKGRFEVDIIADMDGKLVPFEVKYRSPGHTGLADLKGMVEFCEGHGIERGYVITRELGDFRAQAVPCYWLGRSEHETANRGECD